MISKIKQSPVFLVKLALAVAFIMHGASKLLNIGGTAEFLQMSAMVVVIIGLLEVLAGVGILFNQTAKYSAYVIVVIMLGAISMMKYKMGYLGGYELDIAYIAMALTVALSVGCKCEDGTCEVKDEQSERVQQEEKLGQDLE
ncbi:DoxX family protein [Candidatus Parcubacteria bacterium]|nr:DoxX family protein [Candidatus Parcubacteria bacterium]